MSRTDVLDHRPGTSLATASGEVRSSFQARQLTRGYLAALSPPPGAEATDAALLVVSELVTNAFRHGSGLTAFRLGTSGRLLHVTVGDNSPAPPRERASGLAGDGGFGWPLIRHFASEVTVRPDPGGRSKTIHASVPLTAD